MSWDDELNDRKKAILRSIVDDYIHTAQPVGSRTISRKHELGLSSATIRNEMADLEDLGYIAQPHTSSGRVPSDKGYRFYVDNLVQVQELANEEMQRIRIAMHERIGELGDLVRRAATLISAVTGYATLAMTPQAEESPIRSIQIVPVGAQRVLVIVVTSGGVVNSRVVWLDRELSDDGIHRLSSFLGQRLEGKPVSEVTIRLMMEVEQVLDLPDGIVLPVIEGIRECMRRVGHSEIMLDGLTNLFNFPEFSDLLKAREIMDLLREEDVLSAMLHTVGKRTGMEVRIGSENNLGPMRDMSLVTAGYGDGEHHYGAIGVIGPTRMAYSRVIASIDYVRKLLDREMLRLMRD
jgi:heat-inducible transcriptional repressor